MSTYHQRYRYEFDIARVVERLHDALKPTIDDLVTQGKHTPINSDAYIAQNKGTRQVELLAQRSMEAEPCSLAKLVDIKAVFDVLDVRTGLRGMREDSFLEVVAPVLCPSWPHRVREWFCTIDTTETGIVGWRTLSQHLASRGLHLGEILSREFKQLELATASSTTTSQDAESEGIRPPLKFEEKPDGHMAFPTGFHVTKPFWLTVGKKKGFVGVCDDGTVRYFDTQTSMSAAAAAAAGAGGVALSLTGRHEMLHFIDNANQFRLADLKVSRERPHAYVADSAGVVLVYDTDQNCGRTGTIFKGYRLQSANSVKPLTITKTVKFDPLKMERPGMNMSSNRNPKYVRVDVDLLPLQSPVDVTRDMITAIEPRVGGREVNFFVGWSEGTIASFSPEVINPVTTAPTQIIRGIHTDAVTCLQHHTANVELRGLISSSLDGSLVVTDLEKNVAKMHFANASVSANPLTTNEWLSTTGVGGAVSGVPDTATSGAHFGSDTHRSLTQFDVSPNLPIIAAAGTQRYVTLWSGQSRRHLVTFADHRDDVISLHFNSIYELVTMGSDRTIRVYDIRTYRPVQVIRDKERKYSGDPLTGMCVDGGDNSIVSWSGTPFVHRPIQGAVVLLAHGHPVTYAELVEDESGMSIAVTTNDVFELHAADTGDTVFKYVCNYGSIKAVAHDDSWKRIFVLTDFFVEVVIVGERRPSRIFDTAGYHLRTLGFLQGQGLTPSYIVGGNASAILFMSERNGTGILQQEHNVPLLSLTKHKDSKRVEVVTVLSCHSGSGRVVVGTASGEVAVIMVTRHRANVVFVFGADALTLTKTVALMKRGKKYTPEGRMLWEKAVVATKKDEALGGKSFTDFRHERQGKLNHQCDSITLVGDRHCIVGFGSGEAAIAELSGENSRFVARFPAAFSTGIGCCYAFWDGVLICGDDEGFLTRFECKVDSKPLVVVEEVRKRRRGDDKPPRAADSSSGSPSHTSRAAPTSSQPHQHQQRSGSFVSTSTLNVRRASIGGGACDVTQSGEGVMTSIVATAAGSPVTQDTAGRELSRSVNSNSWNSRVFDGVEVTNAPAHIAARRRAASKSSVSFGEEDDDPQDSSFYKMSKDAQAAALAELNLPISKNASTVARSSLKPCDDIPSAVKKKATAATSVRTEKFFLDCYVAITNVTHLPFAITAVTMRTDILVVGLECGKCVALSPTTLDFIWKGDMSISATPAVKPHQFINYFGAAALIGGIYDEKKVVDDDKENKAKEVPTRNAGLEAKESENSKGLETDNKKETKTIGDDKNKRDATASANLSTRPMLSPKRGVSLTPQNEMIGTKQHSPRSQQSAKEHSSPAATAAHATHNDSISTTVSAEYDEASLLSSQRSGRPPRNPSVPVSTAVTAQMVRAAALSSTHGQTVIITEAEDGPGDDENDNEYDENETRGGEEGRYEESNQSAQVTRAGKDDLHDTEEVCEAEHGHRDVLKSNVRTLPDSSGWVEAPNAAGASAGAPKMLFFPAIPISAVAGGDAAHVDDGERLTASHPVPPLAVPSHDTHQKVLSLQLDEKNGSFALNCTATLTTSRGFGGSITERGEPRDVVSSEREGQTPNIGHLSRGDLHKMNARETTNNNKDNDSHAQSGGSPSLSPAASVSLMSPPATASDTFERLLKMRAEGPLPSGPSSSAFASVEDTHGQRKEQREGEESHNNDVNPDNAQEKRKSRHRLLIPISRSKSHGKRESGPNGGQEKALPARDAIDHATVVVEKVPSPSVPSLSTEKASAPPVADDRTLAIGTLTALHDPFHHPSGANGKQTRTIHSSKAKGAGVSRSLAAIPLLHHRLYPQTNPENETMSQHNRKQHLIRGVAPLVVDELIRHSSERDERAKTTEQDIRRENCSRNKIEVSNVDDNVLVKRSGSIEEEIEDEEDSRYASTFDNLLTVATSAVVPLAFSSAQIDGRASSSPSHITTNGENNNNNNFSRARVDLSSTSAGGTSLSPRGLNTSRVSKMKRELFGGVGIDESTIEDREGGVVGDKRYVSTVTTYGRVMNFAGPTTRVNTATANRKSTGGLSFPRGRSSTGGSPTTSPSSTTLSLPLQQPAMPSSDASSRIRQRTGSITASDPTLPLRAGGSAPRRGSARGSEGLAVDQKVLPLQPPVFGLNGAFDYYNEDGRPMTADSIVVKHMQGGLGGHEAIAPVTERMSTELKTRLGLYSPPTTTTSLRQNRLVQNSKLPPRPGTSVAFSRPSVNVGLPPQHQKLLVQRAQSAPRGEIRVGGMAGAHELSTNGDSGAGDSSSPPSSQTTNQPTIMTNRLFGAIDGSSANETGPPSAKGAQLLTRRGWGGAHLLPLMSLGFGAEHEEKRNEEEEVNTKDGASASAKVSTEARHRGGKGKDAISGGGGTMLLFEGEGTQQQRRYMRQAGNASAAAKGFGTELEFEAAENERLLQSKRGILPSSIKLHTRGPSLCYQRLSLEPVVDPKSPAASSLRGGHLKKYTSK